MWLPHRPSLRLLCAPTVEIGADVEALLVLTCARRLRVESIGLTILGQEPPWPPELEAATFLRLTTELRGPCTLNKGEHRMPFRFSVPRDHPPSTARAIAYSAHAQVCIRWWPDAHERFRLNVRGGRVDFESDARTYASRADARGSAPYAEIRVDQTSLRPGDLLEGEVALFNADASPSMHVSLVGTLIDKARTHVYERRSTKLTSVTGDGNGRRFRMRVPSDLAPSFGFERGTRQSERALRWELDVALRAKETLRLRVPLQILPHSAERSPDADALPAVGNARIERLWESVAHSFGLRFDGQRIEGEHNGVYYALKRTQYAEGSAVRATLRFPDAGLGLRVAPRERWWNRRFSSESRLSHDDYAIDGRERAQLERAMGKAAHRVLSFPVAYWTDTQCDLRFPESGMSASGMYDVVRATKQVAERIDRWHASIPPPTALEQAMPEWQRLADTLNASLRVGSCAVFRDGDGSRIETRYDEHGAPEGTEWSVPGFVDGKPIRCSGDARHAALAGVAQEPRALLLRASEDALLSADSGRISVYVPRLFGTLDGPTLAEASRRLEELMRASRWLQRNQSVYR